MQKESCCVGDKIQKYTDVCPYCGDDKAAQRLLPYCPHCGDREKVSILKKNQYHCGLCDVQFDIN